MATQQGDQDLRAAVAVMAHVLYSATATAAVLSEKIPDEEVRADALKTFDELSDYMQRLVRMFPPESLLPEYKGILH